MTHNKHGTFKATGGLGPGGNPTLYLALHYVERVFLL